MISSQHLSYSAKKALAKGVVAGIAMMSVYILVVIVTTPSLSASASIKAALDVNSIIIAGTSTAVGARILFKLRQVAWLQA